MVGPKKTLRTKLDIWPNGGGIYTPFPLKPLFVLPKKFYLFILIFIFRSLIIFSRTMDP